MFEVGHFGAYALGFDRRRQVLGQALHGLQKLLAPGQGVQGAGVPATRLLDVEIRLRHVQQGVVVRGLHVVLSGLDDLLGRQRREDGVRGGEYGDRASAEHVLITAVDELIAGVALGAAVVAIIAAAQVDGGQPEDVGLVEPRRATRKLAWAAAITRGRPSASRSAVARLMGNCRSQAPGCSNGSSGGFPSVKTSPCISRVAGPAPRRNMPALAAAARSHGPASPGAARS